METTSSGKAAAREESKTMLTVDIAGGLLLALSGWKSSRSLT